VPAYVLLHDSTLAAIAAARPGTPDQLLAIPGMGPVKVTRMGAAILELVAGAGAAQAGAGPGERPRPASA
jgi:superfamily II DNA helicase RecQ